MHGIMYCGVELNGVIGEKKYISVWAVLFE